MQVLKKLCNVFAIILSSILSLVLVLLLIAAPLVSALCSFTRPATISTVIRDIDFVEIVTQHEPLRLTLDKYGIDGHFLDGITETDLTEKLVEAYVQSLFEGKKFNPQIVEEIVIAYKEEAISLFRRLAEEKGNNVASLSDEAFFEQILFAIRTEWQQITSVLPTAEDMGISQNDYQQWITDFSHALNAPMKAPTSDIAENVEQNMQSIGQAIISLRTGFPVKVVVTVIILFSVLILLLRWPRFKGFMWLSVVYLLAAALAFAVSGAMASLPAQMLLNESNAISAVLTPVANIFVGEITSWCVWFAIIGIIMLVVFILGRVAISAIRKNTDVSLKQTENDAPATGIPAETAEEFNEM